MADAPPLREADDIRDRDLRHAGRHDERDRAAGVTCAPAAGDWLMTEPAGTVALACVVTAPTVRPASVMADEAAVCVRPTTSGTATCGTPLDTTSATALPVSTCAPAAGDWLMTEPAGTVRLAAVRRP